MLGFGVGVEIDGRKCPIGRRVVDVGLLCAKPRAAAMAAASFLLRFAYCPERRHRHTIVYIIYGITPYV